MSGPVYFVACKNMTRVEGGLEEGDPRIDQELYVCGQSNPDCPSINDGMEHGVTYTFEENNWYRIADRWWDMVDWIVKLSDLIGLNGERPERDSTVAFRDIFRFGNHGGTFGPLTCKKIAADFALWDERAQTFDDEEFYESFKMWRHMFEFAAEGGACWLRCW